MYVALFPTDEPVIVLTSEAAVEVSDNEVRVWPSPQARLERPTAPTIRLDIADPDGPAVVWSGSERTKSEEA